jgi:hypothetical protein
LRRPKLVTNRRESEVHNPDFAGTIDHDVGWLQITVQHAFRMRRRQPRTEFERNLHGLIHRKFSNSLK